MSIKSNIREQMCRIGKCIWQRGFCGGNEGNHSVKLEDGTFLCTPTGISKGFLTPDMIIHIDEENNLLEESEYKSTSEMKMHLAIYKKFPEIGAIVHSHPVHATAFAVCGRTLPEGIHPEAEVFLGRIPLAPYAQPSTMDLAYAVINVMDKETSAVLMENHGALTVGKTLVQTYYNMEILDNYARILINAMKIGTPQILSKERFQGLLEVKKSFGIQDRRENQYTEIEEKYHKFLNDSQIEG